jgi:hypothetical protein
VIGVVAVIAGGWIAQITLSMSNNMSAMSENMKGIAEYMSRMDVNMANMSSDMNIMQIQVKAMTNSVFFKSRDAGCMSQSFRGMQEVPDG